MGDFLNEFPAIFKDDFTTANWNEFAPVNIKESKDAYLLELVVPGLDKNDFKVNLDRNVLTISAEKKSEVKNEDEKNIRREYTYNSFKRSFTFDEKIDEEKIEAKYLNGVLTLNLPKKDEVKASAKEILIH
jgi:HSP20 family protein